MRCFIKRVQFPYASFHTTIHLSFPPNFICDSHSFLFSFFSDSLHCEAWFVLSSPCSLLVYACPFGPTIIWLWYRPLTFFLFFSIPALEAPAIFFSSFSFYILQTRSLIFGKDSYSGLPDELYYNEGMRRGLSQRYIVATGSVYCLHQLARFSWFISWSPEWAFDNFFEPNRVDSPLTQYIDSLFQTSLFLISKTIDAAHDLYHTTHDEIIRN